jgi:hypothetical protein
MYMPRAIVMMRGESTDRIRHELSRLVEQRFTNDLFVKDGVIVEYYMDCFGWFDYMISLWGSNVELLQLSIERIRKVCDAYTSTIVGVLPYEKTESVPFFEQTLNEFAHVEPSKKSNLNSFLHKKNLTRYWQKLQEYAEEIRGWIDA